MISAEANEISEKDAKKTIACEHITKALEDLGFSDYVPGILEVAQQFKTQQVVGPAGDPVQSSADELDTREEAKQDRAERLVSRGTTATARRAISIFDRKVQCCANGIEADLVMHVGSAEKRRVRRNKVACNNSTCNGSDSDVTKQP